MDKLDVLYEIWDLRPGRGKKKGIIKYEHMYFDIPPGTPKPIVQFKPAGEHWQKLMKEYNGTRCRIYGLNRFQIRYYFQKGNN